MRAPLSIVIPTLDAAGTLPATLAALGEGLLAGLIRELVIGDGGSTDATLALAEAAGAVVVGGAPGRGAQIGRAIAVSRGPWIMVLHADTRLGPGWSEVVRRHIATAPGRAGYFALRFDAAGVAPRLVAGWANLRARAFGLPYGDQGLVVARDVLAAAGGYPDLALMEDVALARRLRGRLTLLPAVALTGAGRYLRHGWLRQGAHNLWRLARYLAGADPARLAKEYQEAPRPSNCKR